MVSRSHTGSIVGRQEQEDRQEEGVSRSGELLQSIAIIDRLQEGGVLKTVMVVTVSGDNNIGDSDGVYSN